MDLQHTLLLLFTFVTVDTALELPPYIKKCPGKPAAALRECATKQAPQVLAAMAKGDRKYDVPPLDPFTVESMEVEQPSVTLKFTNMQLFGYSKSIITDVIRDESKKEFKVDYLIPKVRSVAHCSLDVNLRVIRLKGEGECEYDIFNLTIHWKAPWTIEKHADGYEYMKFVDAQINIEPAKMVFKFEKLINNDATLGTAVNEILNENWRDIFNEVKPAVESVFGELQVVAMNGIAGHVAVENVFG